MREKAINSLSCSIFISLPLSLSPSLPLSLSLSLSPHQFSPYLPFFFTPQEKFSLSESLMHVLVELLNTEQIFSRVLHFFSLFVYVSFGHKP